MPQNNIRNIYLVGNKTLFSYPSNTWKSLNSKYDFTKGQNLIEIYVIINLNKSGLANYSVL